MTAVALVGGVAAGLLGFALQAVGVTPLILRAEAYETGAPAAAVTAIIILLVAVAARSGMPIVRCMTGSFTIPPPTPSSAEMTPANTLSTEATRR